MEPAITKLYEQNVKKEMRELVEAMSVGFKSQQQERTPQAPGRGRGSGKKDKEQTAKQIVGQEEFSR